MIIVEFASLRFNKTFDINEPYINIDPFTISVRPIQSLWGVLFWGSYSDISQAAHF